jgi:hypothetical protein
MAYLIFKYALTAAVIVAISELAKRSPGLGALLASLPLTSLLAFIWFYQESGDAAKIATMAVDILFLIIPSLLLFCILPWLIRIGWGFYPALAAGCIATAAGYGLMMLVLAHYRR